MDDRGIFQVNIEFNHIQAGAFRYYIGWEGHNVPPPFLFYLLSNYHQTWHGSTLA